MVDFAPVLKPADTAWLPSVSPDEFFQRAQGLRVELDDIKHDLLHDD